MQIAATPQRSPLLGQDAGQRAEDARARRAERVADGDRAALAVDDGRVDVPRAHAGQGLRGERLVELDGADVGPGDAGPLDGQVGSLDRREAEELRVEGGGPAPGDARDGLRDRASFGAQHCRAAPRMPRR